MKGYYRTPRQARACVAYAERPKVVERELVICISQLRTYDSYVRSYVVPALRRQIRRTL